MIGIFQLYQKALGRFNTHQGGHIKPSNFIDWVDDTQLEILNEEFDKFQISQSNSDRLTPFLTSVNIFLVGQSGSSWDLITKPSDYEYFSSARIVKKKGESCGCAGIKSIDGNGKEIKDITKCKFIDEDELTAIQLQNDKDNCEYSIKLVDNDRWGAICEHKTKAPTKTKPIITQYSGGFKIAPKACTSAIILDYFRRPAKPIFNFTVINPNTKDEYIQFIQSGSVDLEWSETLIEEFMIRLQKKYATFVGQDSMYAQAVNDKKEIKK